MNIFCNTWSSPEVYITKTVRVYIFDDALKKNPYMYVLFVQRNLNWCNCMIFIRLTQTMKDSFKWVSVSSMVRKGEGVINEAMWVILGGGGLTTVKSSFFTWRKCPLLLWLLLILPTQCNIQIVFASEESYNKECIMLSDKIRGWSAHARIYM